MANKLQTLQKTCDVCKMKTGTDFNSELDFGPWMQKSKLLVHYYCLLLSTDMQQNGKDTAGILGFEIRDIQKCIAKVANTNCYFCGNNYATIRCAQCREYFHLVCGVKRGCLFQFIGEFVSYCTKCFLLNDFQKNVIAKQQTVHCYICRGVIATYNPANWIYGPCCQNGFVHSICMRRYALSAGYYLRCIWCKSDKFRDMIRRMGIFVPDREANWEGRNAYQDLHKGHKCCDMENCLCPRGRDYFTPKWELILCECCGGFGAHNPICVIGDKNALKKVERFKCNTCTAIELKSARSRTSMFLSKSLKESDTDTDDIISPCEKISNFSNSSNDTVYQKIKHKSNSAVIDLCTPADSYSPTEAILVETENKEESSFSRSSTETVQANANQSNGTNFETIKCVACDDAGEPIGIATVRVDLNSNRFQGMTLQEISDKSSELLVPEDIISITDDLSIIHKIHEIIRNFAIDANDTSS